MCNNVLQGYFIITIRHSKKVSLLKAGCLVAIPVISVKKAHAPIGLLCTQGTLKPCRPHHSISR